MASKPEPEVARAQPRKPTAREEYEFDLKGYSLTPGALSPAELATINSWIDGLQPFKPPGEWYGHVETHSYYGTSTAGEIDDGVNLQHVFEAGPVFEALLDHPGWIGCVRHFIGSQSPIVHEMFINVRAAPVATPDPRFLVVQCLDDRHTFGFQ